MTGFQAFLRKEWREALATNRVLITLVFFGLFGLLSPATAKYTPELLKSLGNGIQVIVPTPTVADALDQFIRNIAGNGVFASILLAMGAVAREKERGTAALVLTKPLSRAAFLAAKVSMVAVLLGLGVAVSGLLMQIYTLLLFGQALGPGFGVTCLLIWLLLLAFALCTFLGSVLVRSQIVAAGIGIASLVVLSLLANFPALAQWTPSGLLGPARAFGLALAASNAAQPIIGCLALVVVTCGLAWLAFRSQELVAVES